MSHAIPIPSRPALSIPEAFAVQVRRHGGRLAVSEGGRGLTYSELHDASRRAAGALRARIGNEPHAVAILAAHGIDLIIALLAVLEAGKLAIVLDPSDPPDRLRELIAEARAVGFVADTAHAELAAEVAPPGGPVVSLDQAVAAGESAPRTGPGADDIAFVMFTSGSTGKPKGVLVTHGNVVRSVRNVAESAELTADDRLTLLSRAHFMAALSAIFGALLNGACLCPFDVRRYGFRELRDWLVAERITVYHSVPTLFRRFVESLAPGDTFPDIRLVRLGGEPVMNRDVKLWQRHFAKSSVLLNGLGITEANGNLCHFKIDHRTPAEFQVVPVGRPLPGVEIVLLGDDGQPVPGGGIGEIAFRCPYRSPGYWQSDDFASRLVPPPSGEGGEPFFRTGDLGRLRVDGCLEHLGRLDGMLKVNGRRVEPAEVEAVLFADPRIQSCAVGLCGNGSGPKQLVAWFVAAPGATPRTEELRDRLAARLPAGLVPSGFVALAEMPLTPGGKIDRKALPAPSSDEGDRTAGHDRGRQTATKPDDDPAAIDAVHSGAPAPLSAGDGSPRDGIELELASLWKKVLRVSSIAPDDTFFERGGDSLLAAVMLSKAERAFQADVPFSDFLADPSLAATARMIRHTTRTAIHRRMICTRPGGSGTPFFNVPGAGVVDASAGTGSGQPPGPRPHYSLHYRGIDGVERPLNSIPEMAGYFLSEIRKIQPSGPYLIGGGSFGALIALEAAHRLRDDGDDVLLLVVGDSLLPGCLTPKRGASLKERLERALLWLMPVGRRFELTRAGVRDGLRQWRYRALTPLARWRSLRRGTPLPGVYRFHNLLNHSLLAKRRHVLRPYDGKVILLRSRYDAATSLFDVDPTLGWSRLCPRLERVNLDGEKGSRRFDPARQAEYLAHLDAVLDAADPAAARATEAQPAEILP